MIDANPFTEEVIEQQQLVTSDNESSPNPTLNITNQLAKINTAREETIFESDASSDDTVVEDLENKSSHEKVIPKNCFTDNKQMLIHN